MQSPKLILHVLPKSKKVLRLSKFFFAQNSVQPSARGRLKLKGEVGDFLVRHHFAVHVVIRVILCHELTQRFSFNRLYHLYVKECQLYTYTLYSKLKML